MRRTPEETRQEQYLRILTDGPDGEADYEAVRYLVDKGYSDSQYIVSRMTGSFGLATRVWRKQHRSSVHS